MSEVCAACSGLRPGLHTLNGLIHKYSAGSSGSMLLSCPPLEVSQLHGATCAQYPVPGTGVWVQVGDQACTKTIVDSTRIPSSPKHSHQSAPVCLYSVRLPAQLAHMPHATLCCLLAPAKPARQDTRRGAVCRAKWQPPEHYWSCGLWLTPACVRRLAGKHVTLLTSARSC